MIKLNDEPLLERIAALEARVRELEAVLVPFAKASENFASWDRGDKLVTFDRDGIDVTTDLTVSHLLAAWDVLSLPAPAALRQGQEAGGSPGNDQLQSSRC